MHRVTRLLALLALVLSFLKPDMAYAQRGYALTPFDLVIDGEFVPSDTPLEPGQAFEVAFGLVQVGPFREAHAAGTLTFDLDGAECGIEPRENCLFGLTLGDPLPNFDCIGGTNGDPLSCTWDEVPPQDLDGGGFTISTPLSLVAPVVTEETQITIEGTVNPAEPGPPETAGTQEITLTVQPPEADETDLETILSLPAEVAPGATFTFDVTVRNNGPETSLPFTMIAFGQGTILSADPDDGCGINNTGLLECVGKGPLEPGASTAITVTAQAPEQGEDDPDFIVQGRWLNAAQEDPAPGNDLVIDRIPFGEGGGTETDLSLDCEREAGKQDDPIEVNVGEEVTVICTFSNQSEEDAENAVVAFSSDPEDGVEDVRLIVTGGGWESTSPTTIATPTFSGGATSTIDIQFIPTKVGDLTTTVFVESDTQDSDPTDNTVTTNYDVQEEVLPDLNVDIIGADEAPLVGTLSGILLVRYPFTIRVENLNTAGATSKSSQTTISLPDSILLDLEVTSVPPPCTFEPATAFPIVRCQNGALAPGDDIQFGLEIEFRLEHFLDVVYTTKDITATVQPLNPEADEDTGNHSDMKSFALVPPTEFIFTDPVRTVPSGVVLVNGVEVTNNTEDEQQVTLNFSSSDEDIVKIQEVTTEAGVCPYDEATGEHTCDVTVPPGETKTAEVTAEAKDEGEATLRAENPQTGQVAESTTTVEEERPLPDLFVQAVVMTEDGGFDDPYVAPGEVYTVEVKARNIGLEKSSGSTTEFTLPDPTIELLDPLPAGCQPLAGAFATCENGPLDSGDTRTYLFTLRAPDEGVLRHFSEIIPADPDADETNHTWTATTRVAEETVDAEVTAPEQTPPDFPTPVRVLVGNRSDETAEDVDIAIDAGGLSVSDARCTPDCDAETDGTTVTSILDELEPNESSEVLFDIEAEETGEHEMTVTMTLLGEVIYSETFTVEITDTVPCAVTKTVEDDATPAVGKPFEYNITVAAGDDPVADVNLRDPLPQGLDIPLANNGFSPRYPAPDDCEYTEPGGFLSPANGLECHFPLAAGEARTVPFFVEADRPGVVTNIATACGLTAGEAIDAQDLDVRILPSTVDGLDILTDLGAQFNIETLVTNTGSEPAPDVEVNLSVVGAAPFFDERDPVFVNFISSDQCSFGPSESTATCSLGTLDPGESTRLTLFAQAVLEGVNKISAMATSEDDREARDQRRIFSDSRETRMEWANTAFGDDGNKQAAAVDVYVDGTLVVDDLAPGAATAFQALTLTQAVPRVEITAAAAPDNSDPLATFTADFFGTPEDSLAFSETNLLLLTDTPGDTLGLVVKKAARTEAEDPSKAEVAIVHASPDAPVVSVAVNGSGMPAETLAFGEGSDYGALDPGPHFLVVNDVATGEVVDVIRFDVGRQAGQAVALVLTGRLADGSLGLTAFDGTGTAVPTPVEAPTALPQQFVLHGNYPNPFNPTTRLHFDLPEPGEVHVAVYDVLGRRVLTLSNEPMEPGFGRTLEVDASALASGVYLYRVVARSKMHTRRQTGRMVVLK